MTTPIMPKNVARFERIAYLTVALSAASMPLNWNTISKYLDQYPISYPLILFTFFSIQFLWIWLIARRRKNWARWISLAFLIISLPGMILNYEPRLNLGITVAVVYYIEYLMWCVAISLLFTRDARGWFRPAPGTFAVAGGISPNSTPENSI
jgi:hypothetical protein